MTYTFLAVFVRFVAPTSGEEALVSKPVAARGFMSGRGPEHARSAGEWEGRSERSERRVLTPMLPAAGWGKLLSDCCKKRLWHSNKIAIFVIL